MINENIRMNLGFNVTNPQRYQLEFGDEVSLTKQAFAAECDINNIVEKFQRTGQMPVTNNLEARYEHVPVLDLKDSLDLVFAARKEFNELPDEVKTSFGHDEDNYYNFLSNPDHFIDEIERKFEARSDLDSSVDSPSADNSLKSATTPE